MRSLTLAWLSRKVGDSQRISRCRLLLMSLHRIDCGNRRVTNLTSNHQSREYNSRPKSTPSVGSGGLVIDQQRATDAGACSTSRALQDTSHHHAERDDALMVCSLQCTLHPAAHSYPRSLARIYSEPLPGPYRTPTSKDGHFVAASVFSLPFDSSPTSYQ